MGRGMMLTCSSLIEFLHLGTLKFVLDLLGLGLRRMSGSNVKNAVRERSIPLEHSECHRLKVGDFVCCFQERRDQAQYFDAHIVNIQRKTHDIRGCRCLFLERVRLRRLCCRPT
uniref:SAWADEE domain-containing protein n=1 Tax=Salix viminalis TaxID=40686 RepID=A0A6N2NIP1_SALVM